VAHVRPDLPELSFPDIAEGDMLGKLVGMNIAPGIDFGKGDSGTVPSV
jgi:hypothetical protein